MELKLPELGEGVHEGELVKWKVKAGDSVKDDQVLCEIMTDKATVELPSSFSGKITGISVKEGVTVHVGQTLLTYEGTGKSAQAQASTTAPTANKLSSQVPSQAPMTAAPMSAASASVAAAPSTRRFAREAGVDLASVTPSGPHGRVMKEDIEQHAKGAGAIKGGPAKYLPSPARAPGQLEERIAFKGLRKKISEKMRLSKDKAAHFTYVEECDATEIVKLRTQAKELGAAAGVKVTYLPFVMKAMVAALKKYPTLNSTLDEGTQEWVIKHYYNIGISVQTDDGLTAPVIKDVAHKSILQIAKEIQDVVDRARSKRLTMDDLTGGTMTLTNAGSIGGLFATPVINFPEVAILGFNKIFKKPVVKTINGSDQVVIRDWTLFSISLDHRLVDGAVGAEYMKLFISYIENPALLLLESNF